MTPEAPIQIDLSDDNSWDQVDDSLLTQDDKNLLKEHFTEEHEGIIYLTKQEIEELKVTIAATQDPRGEAGSKQILGESFKEFIEEQKREGLSSGDIISGVEGNLLTPELLDNLDKASEEILFSAEGLFTGLDISDTAKDHISVSLTLTILESIKSDPTKLQGMLDQLKLGNTDIATTLTQEYNEKFSSISQVFGQQYDISGEAFIIPGQGENNKIFMETDAGREFFAGIISGEITPTNVITKIREQNTDNAIVPNSGDIQKLRSIGTLTVKELQAIVPPAGALIPKVNPEVAKTALEKLSEMKPFGAFLAAILEALQGMIGNIGDTTPQKPRNQTTGPDTTPIVREQRQDIKEFFTQHANEGVFVGMNKESILTLFPESGELSETAQNIIRKLDAIPGEGKLQEKMRNLFIDEIPLSDTDATKGKVPRLNRFLHDMKSVTDTQLTIKNTDGTINSSGFLTAINSYTSYRTENISWKAIAENSEKNRNMTYVEYFTANTQDTEE